MYERTFLYAEKLFYIFIENIFNKMIFALSLLVLFSEEISSHVMIENWSTSLVQNLISDLGLREISLVIDCVKTVKITSYNTILKEII